MGGWQDERIDKNGVGLVLALVTLLVVVAVGVEWGEVGGGGGEGGGGGGGGRLCSGWGVYYAVVTNFTWRGCT